MNVIEKKILFTFCFSHYGFDSAAASLRNWKWDLLDRSFWFSSPWNAPWNTMTTPSYYPQAKVNLSRVAHSSPAPFHPRSCLSSSDSPITQTVPMLGSGCLGVKFIPFTIDSPGGARVLPGLRGALKLSVEKEAYEESLNCFLWGST